MAAASENITSWLDWDDHLLDFLLFGWIGWAALVVLVVNAVLTFFEPLQPQREWARTKEGVPGKKVAATGGAESCVWLNSALNWFYLHYDRFPEFVDVWVKALNEQSVKLGGPVQVKFERVKSGSLPPKFSEVTFEAGPEDKYVLHCKTDSRDVSMAVFASQQTTEGVKLTNLTTNILRLKGSLKMKCFREGQDMMVNVGFEGRPDVKVIGKPVNPYQDPNDLVDVGVVETVVRNAICLTSSTFNITKMLTGSSGNLTPRIVGDKPVSPVNLSPRTEAVFEPIEVKETQQSAFHAPSLASAPMLSSAPRPSRPTPGDKRLLVKVIKASALGGRDVGSVDPTCVVVMDSPPQSQATSVVKSTVNPFWDEQFLFDITNNTREVKFEVVDRRKPAGENFLGEAYAYYEDLKRTPSSRQIIPLQGNPALGGDMVTGSITVEFLFLDPIEAESVRQTMAAMSPKRTVEVNQAKTPGGTLVTKTTTTTERSRHGRQDAIVDGSPNYIEKHTNMYDYDGSDTTSHTSPNASLIPHDRSVSSSSEQLHFNGIESIAETAIRELMDRSRNPRTPTKTSTLIITGVKRASDKPTEDRSESPCNGTEIQPLPPVEVKSTETQPPPPEVVKITEPGPPAEVQSTETQPTPPAEVKNTETQPGPSVVEDSHPEVECIQEASIIPLLALSQETVTSDQSDIVQEPPFLKPVPVGMHPPAEVKPFPGPKKNSTSDSEQTGITTQTSPDLTQDLDFLDKNIMFEISYSVGETIDEETDSQLGSSQDLSADISSQVGTDSAQEKEPSVDTLPLSVMTDHTIQQEALPLTESQVECGLDVVTETSPKYEVGAEEKTVLSTESESVESSQDMTADIPVEPLSELVQEEAVSGLESEISSQCEVSVNEEMTPSTETFIESDTKVIQEEMLPAAEVGLETCQEVAPDLTDIIYSRSPSPYADDSSCSSYHDEEYISHSSTEDLAADTTAHYFELEHADYPQPVPLEETGALSPEDLSVQAECYEEHMTDVENLKEPSAQEIQEQVTLGSCSQLELAPEPDEKAVPIISPASAIDILPEPEIVPTDNVTQQSAVDLEHSPEPEAISADEPILHSAVTTSVFPESVVRTKDPQEEYIVTKDALPEQVKSSSAEDILLTEVEHMEQFVPEEMASYCPAFPAERSLAVQKVLCAETVHSETTQPETALSAGDIVQMQPSGELTSETVLCGVESSEKFVSEETAEPCPSLPVDRTVAAQTEFEEDTLVSEVLPSDSSLSADLIQVLPVKSESSATTEQPVEQVIQAEEVPTETLVQLSEIPSEGLLPTETVSEDTVQQVDKQAFKDEEISADMTLQQTDVSTEEQLIVEPVAVDEDVIDSTAEQTCVQVDIPVDEDAVEYVVEQAVQEEEIPAEMPLQQTDVSIQEQLIVEPITKDDNFMDSPAEKSDVQVDVPVEEPMKFTEVPSEEVIPTEAGKEDHVEEQAVQEEEMPLDVPLQQTDGSTEEQLIFEPKDVLPTEASTEDVVEPVDEQPVQEEEIPVEMPLQQADDLTATEEQLIVEPVAKDDNVIDSPTEIPDVHVDVPVDEPTKFTDVPTEEALPSEADKEGVVEHVDEQTVLEEEIPVDIPLKQADDPTATEEQLIVEPVAKDDNVIDSPTEIPDVPIDVPVDEPIKCTEVPTEDVLPTEAGKGNVVEHAEEQVIQEEEIRVEMPLHQTDGSTVEQFIFEPEEVSPSETGKEDVVEHSDEQPVQEEEMPVDIPLQQADDPTATEEQLIVEPVAKVDNVIDSPTEIPDVPIDVPVDEPIKFTEIPTEEALPTEAGKEGVVEHVDEQTVLEEEIPVDIPLKQADDPTATEEQLIVEPVAKVDNFIDSPTEIPDVHVDVPVDEPTKFTDVPTEEALPTEAGKEGVVEHVDEQTVLEEEIPVDIPLKQADDPTATEEQLIVEPVAKVDNFIDSPTEIPDVHVDVPVDEPTKFTDVPTEEALPTEAGKEGVVEHVEQTVLEEEIPVDIPLKQADDPTATEEQLIVEPVAKVDNFIDSPTEIPDVHVDVPVDEPTKFTDVPTEEALPTEAGKENVVEHVEEQGMQEEEISIEMPLQQADHRTEEHLTSETLTKDEEFTDFPIDKPDVQIAVKEHELFIEMSEQPAEAPIENTLPTETIVEDEDAISDYDDLPEHIPADFLMEDVGGEELEVETEELAKFPVPDEEDASEPGSSEFYPIPEGEKQMVPEELEESKTDTIGDEATEEIKSPGLPLEDLVSADSTIEEATVDSPKVPSDSGNDKLSEESLPDRNLHLDIEPDNMLVEMEQIASDMASLAEDISKSPILAPKEFPSSEPKLEENITTTVVLDPTEKDILVAAEASLPVSCDSSDVSMTRDSSQEMPAPTDGEIPDDSPATAGDVVVCSAVSAQPCETSSTNVDGSDEQAPVGLAEDRDEFERGTEETALDLSVATRDHLSSISSVSGIIQDLPAHSVSDLESVVLEPTVVTVKSAADVFIPESSDVTAEELVAVGDLLQEVSEYSSQQKAESRNLEQYTDIISEPTTDIAESRMEEEISSVPLDAEDTTLITSAAPDERSPETSSLLCKYDVVEDLSLSDETFTTDDTILETPEEHDDDSSAVSIYLPEAIPCEEDATTDVSFSACVMDTDHEEPPTEDVTLDYPVLATETDLALPTSSVPASAELDKSTEDSAATQAALRRQNYLAEQAKKKEPIEGSGRTEHDATIALCEHPVETSPIVRDVQPDESSTEVIEPASKQPTELPKTIVVQVESTAITGPPKELVSEFMSSSKHEGSEDTFLSLSRPLRIRKQVSSEIEDDISKVKDKRTDDWVIATTDNVTQTAPEISTVQSPQPAAETVQTVQRPVSVVRPQRVENPQPASGKVQSIRRPGFVMRPQSVEKPQPSPENVQIIPKPAFVMQPQSVESPQPSPENGQTDHGPSVVMQPSTDDPVPKSYQSQMVDDNVQRSPQPVTDNTTTTLKLLYVTHSKSADSALEHPVERDVTKTPTDSKPVHGFVHRPQYSTLPHPKKPSKDASTPNRAGSMPRSSSSSSTNRQHQTTQSSPTEEVNSDVLIVRTEPPAHGHEEREKKKGLSLAQSIKKRFSRSKKRSKSAERSRDDSHLHPRDQTKDDIELVRAQPDTPSLKKSRSLGGSLKKLFRRGRKRSRDHGETSRDSSYSRSSTRNASQGPSREGSITRGGGGQSSSLTRSGQLPDQKGDMSRGHWSKSTPKSSTEYMEREIDVSPRHPPSASPTYPTLQQEPTVLQPRGYPDPQMDVSRGHRSRPGEQTDVVRPSYDTNSAPSVHAPPSEDVRRGHWSKSKITAGSGAVIITTPKREPLDVVTPSYDTMSAPPEKTTSREKIDTDVVNPVQEPINVVPESNGVTASPSDTPSAEVTTPKTPDGGLELRRGHWTKSNPTENVHIGPVIISKEPTRATTDSVDPEIRKGHWTKSKSKSPKRDMSDSGRISGGGVIIVSSSSPQESKLPSPPEDIVKPKSSEKDKAVSKQPVKVKIVKVVPIKPERKEPVSPLPVETVPEKPLIPPPAGTRRGHWSKSDTEQPTAGGMIVVSTEPSAVPPKPVEPVDIRKGHWTKPKTS